MSENEYGEHEDEHKVKINILTTIRTCYAQSATRICTGWTTEEVTAERLGLVWSSGRLTVAVSRAPLRFSRRLLGSFEGAHGANEPFGTATALPHTTLASDETHDVSR